MGYAGGAEPSPTYHDLGGHTEAVEVTFDPARVSYDELLDVYWNSFPFSIPPGPSRVRTAVFARGDDQLATAEASKRRLERRTGERVTVEIVAGGDFWPAERMHQKFHLQRVYPDLVSDLAGGDVDAFLSSGAAARLNAYVSGFVDASAVREAAADLGWPVEELLARLDAAPLEADRAGPASTSS